MAKKISVQELFEKDKNVVLLDVVKDKCTNCSSFEEISEVLNKFSKSKQYVFSADKVQRYILKDLKKKGIELKDFLPLLYGEKKKSGKTSYREIIEEKTKKSFVDLLKSKCKKETTLEEAYVEFNKYIVSIGFAEDFLKINTFENTIKKCILNKEITEDDKIYSWFHKEKEKELVHKKSKRYHIEERTKKNFFDIINKQCSHCQTLDEALEYLNRYLESAGLGENYLSGAILCSTISKAIENDEVKEGIWDKWLSEAESHKRKKKDVEDVPVKSDVGIKVQLHCSECGAMRDYAVGKSEFIRYGLSLKGLMSIGRNSTDW
jgi:hypothetical protein